MFYIADKFDIESEGGIWTLKSKNAFDYEELPNAFTFKIRAMEESQDCVFSGESMLFRYFNTITLELYNYESKSPTEI